MSHRNLSATSAPRSSNKRSTLNTYNKQMSHGNTTNTFKLLPRQSKLRAQRPFVQIPFLTYASSVLQ
eukprot:16427602-Heterocapsa_arctica.AAC.1